MKNKINIAEILKDCPSGMELYSPLVGDCKFVKVHDYESKIIVEIETGATVVFETDGRYFDCPNAECILFPKGKTTWEGFQRPFKDGDVVAVTMIPVGTWIGIFKQYEKESFESYCSISTNGDFRNIGLKNHSLKDTYLATEEQRDFLFQKIKEAGYKWNPETKTLEKLIEPKFKVGDKVKHIYDKDNRVITITCIKEDCYYMIYFNDRKNDYQCEGVLFADQDKYELVPSKFDINTLKHFDKVLVRNTNKGHWCGQFYMIYDENEEYPFTCTYNSWKQCIPYNEDTKHLTGTTDDCDEYFKIWE